MKHPVLVLLGLLAVAAAPASHAVEILRWERMPLAVPLKVGQERIVFIDRNVRVGVPAGVGERLRVQSAGGAVYLRASEPIEPTRLQLQDADTGALILLDIAAEPPKDGEAGLEPVRIVEGNSTPAHYGDQAGGAGKGEVETPKASFRREVVLAGNDETVAADEQGSDEVGGRLCVEGLEISPHIGMDDQCGTEGKRQHPCHHDEKNNNWAKKGEEVPPPLAEPTAHYLKGVPGDPCDAIADDADV